MLLKHYKPIDAILEAFHPPPGWEYKKDHDKFILLKSPIQTVDLQSVAWLYGLPVTTNRLELKEALLKTKAFQALPPELDFLLLVRPVRTQCRDKLTEDTKVEAIHVIVDPDHYYTLLEALDAAVTHLPVALQYHTVLDLSSPACLASSDDFHKFTNTYFREQQARVVNPPSEPLANLTTLERVSSLGTEMDTPQTPTSTAESRSRIPKQQSNGDSNLRQVKSLQDLHWDTSWDMQDKTRLWEQGRKPHT